MGRAIGGVILGYLAMAVFVMLTFTGAFIMMGVDGAFKPGSYDVSAKWMVVSFGLGLVAALLGGWVCSVIAPASKAPLFLAGLVLVLGLIFAIPVLRSSGNDAPKTRSGDVNAFEAMQEAKQPPAIALLNPIVGAIGVVLGGRLRRRPSSMARP